MNKETEIKIIFLSELIINIIFCLCNLFNRMLAPYSLYLFFLIPIEVIIFWIYNRFKWIQEQFTPENIELRRQSYIRSMELERFIRQVFQIRLDSIYTEPMSFHIDIPLKANYIIDASGSIDTSGINPIPHNPLGDFEILCHKCSNYKPEDHCEINGKVERLMTRFFNCLEEDHDFPKCNEIKSFMVNPRKYELEIKLENEFSIQL